MNINNLADEMLDRIQTSIDTSLQSTIKLRSAIVTSVSKEGRVSVYIPPDSTKEFTNIPNQTPFELKAGDSVELMLKDGFSNCWVTAKHMANYTGISNYDVIKDLINKYENLNARVIELEKNA